VLTSCVTTNARAPAMAPKVAVTSSASHQAVEVGERRRGRGERGGVAIEDDDGMSRIGRCCCRCRREKFDACCDEEDGLAAATVTERCDTDSAVHLRACGRGQLVDPRGRAAMRPSDGVAVAGVVVVRGIEVSTRICFRDRAPRMRTNTVRPSFG